MPAQKQRHPLLQAPSFFWITPYFWKTYISKIKLTFCILKSGYLKNFSLLLDNLELPDNGQLLGVTSRCVHDSENRQYDHRDANDKDQQIDIPGSCVIFKEIVVVRCLNQAQQHGNNGISDVYQKERDTLLGVEPCKTGLGRCKPRNQHQNSQIRQYCHHLIIGDILRIILISSIRGIIQFLEKVGLNRLLGLGRLLIRLLRLGRLLIGLLGFHRLLISLLRLGCLLRLHRLAAHRTKLCVFL